MLIYIDNTIAEFLKKNELNDEQIMLFNDLATANKRGLCIACGHVKSLDLLIEHENIVGGIMKSLRGNATEFKTIAEIVDCVFVLTSSEYTRKRNLPKIIRNKVRLLPIEDATRWRLGNACSLIGENPRDCDFYNIVGHYFCFSHGIRGISIKFSPENGGGGSTGDIMIRCVRNLNKFALCIVDRDWRYGQIAEGDDPESGGTFIAAKKAEEELKQSGLENYFQLFPLEVHEAENLIPFSVLEQLSDTDCSPQGRDLISKLRSIQGGEPIRYLDFKKKMKSGYNVSYDMYWEPIRMELGNDSWDKTFYPVGRKVLEKATVHMKNANYGELIIDDYLKDAWSQLGKVLFSWGCATIPTSA